jgi:hypothetical protein
MKPSPLALVYMVALALPAGTSAQDPLGLLCGAGTHAGERDFVAFPVGGVFCPLAADPKAEHSFMTFLHGEFANLTDLDGNTDMGSVGIADEVPIGRWSGSRPGEGFQFGISGAVFAQFDLESASFDLINADYLISLPLTFRESGFTTRLRVYHQSSHLGDEFVLREDDIERENLSFESLELILSQEVSVLRAYLGGEWLFRREPETLEDLLAHGGLEARIGSPRTPRFLLALDVKSTEEQDWDPAFSARGGFEFAVWREDGHPPRVIGVLAEYYDGPSPYGQFFQNQIHFFGVGLHFSL